LLPSILTDTINAALDGIGEEERAKFWSKNAVHFYRLNEDIRDQVSSR
jgi:hypothetical protein